MTTLTLRAVKGSPLTNQEIDNNFAGLDNEKIQLGGDIGGTTGAPVVISLRGRTFSSASPTTGQAIVWNGTSWIPSTVATGSGAGSSTVTSVVTGTAITTISSVTTTYPAFGAYPSTSVTQTITSGSQQKVLFQNEEFDTNNNFASSRFTPTVAGYYQLNAVVRISGTMGTGESMVVIWKNGTEWKRGWNASGTELGANFFALQVSALVYANGSTDYFEIYIQQGSGGSRDITVAGGNITWFNGIYVPTQLITGVSASTTVNNAVTSTVIQGGGYGITVLNDIHTQFNRKKKIFTLKSGATAITEGLDYGDNKDLTVQIGGRHYNAAVPQTTTLGPWIVDYAAEKTYTYRLTGSRIIFYRPIADRQTAEIRINNVSATRQKRSRYPFTPNTIAFGD
jgi:hypothetical protein